MVTPTNKKPKFRLGQKVWFIGDRCVMSGYVWAAFYGEYDDILYSIDTLAKHGGYSKDSVAPIQHGYFIKTSCVVDEIEVVATKAELIRRIQKEDDED